MEAGEMTAFLFVYCLFAAWALVATIMAQTARRKARDSYLGLRYEEQQNLLHRADLRAQSEMYERHIKDLSMARDKDVKRLTKEASRQRAQVRILKAERQRLLEANEDHQTMVEERDREIKRLRDVLDKLSVIVEDEAHREIRRAVLEGDARAEDYC